MRAIGSIDAAISGSFKASLPSPRVVEKTSASSALGREKPDADADTQKPAPVIQVELVYRDDTSRFDPFWDGPRLVPAFVAQLLGQTMPDRRENAAVETAYGRAISPRIALLLDRKG
jgi:hypothetical protein